MDAVEKNPAPYPTIWQSFVIAGIVILMAIACSPVFALAPSIGAETAMMAYYIFAFGLSFAIVHSIRKRKLGASNYNFRVPSWKIVILLALGAVGLLWGVVAPIASLIPMSETAQESFRTMAGDAGISTFVYFVLAAPLLEELIFRGIILDGLLKRYKPLTSILVSSLIFGLVHLNPWQFVTGFVIGCFLGWVYLRTGSVAACMVIHMSANMCGYLCRILMNLDGRAAPADGVVSAYYGGAMGYVAVTATSILVSALSVFLLRREFDKVASVGPDIAGTINAEVPSPTIENAGACETFLGEAEPPGLL